MYLSCICSCIFKDKGHCLCRKRFYFSESTLSYITFLSTCPRLCTVLETFMDVTHKSSQKSQRLERYCRSRFTAACCFDLVIAEVCWSIAVNLHVMYKDTALEIQCNLKSLQFERMRKVVTWSCTRKWNGECTAESGKCVNNTTEAFSLVKNMG